MLQNLKNNEYERWKDVPGYENLYKISTHGNVYSFISKRFLRPSINKKTKYKCVVLFKNQSAKTWKIHRLVANTFIPNPDNKPFIDHIDGNKLNNNVENLRWVTAKENSNNRHSKSLGFIPRPTRGKSVLCVETNITYPSFAEAARQTGIRADLINRACINTAGGFHWKYVTDS